MVIGAIYCHWYTICNALLTWWCQTHAAIVCMDHTIWSPNDHHMPTCLWLAYGDSHEIGEAGQ